MPEQLDAATVPQENEPSMETIARENFARWNEALKTGDAQMVAGLYAESATFLPTVSGELKRGPIKAEGYFDHFLEKNPTGEVVEDGVQTISPNTYLHSGLYNFEVGEDDARHVIEARFSFLWQKDEQGQWKIIHHHSSLKPE